MTGLFVAVLNMSLSAGCAAFAIILIRLLIRSTPKKYAYALWAVVFLRFICPFSIQLPVSAVPVQPQTIPHDIVYSASIQSGVAVVDNAVNGAIKRALPVADPARSVNPLQAALTIGASVWLAGVSALVLYACVSYTRLKIRLRTAIRVGGGVYETDRIQTPIALGFVRPKIYIPSVLDAHELEYVIEHERTHIRRLDYLIKPLTFLISSVHWFNPMAWVAYALMARDMELSADESVLKRSGIDIRGEYSGSLLALSARKSGLLSPLAFGETGVKARIKNVLRYKKPALWISAAAVLVVVAASVMLMGGRSPKAQAEQDAVDLFGKYGWTVLYEIDSMNIKLGSFDSLSEFIPAPYYFAYNNELSKDIGLDMSEYSDSGGIHCEIYKVYESMPEEFYPIQNCRGIVIKDGDKIIGAYVSAGRHSAFSACSLKRNSFEGVAGKTVDEWLKGKIQADDTEKELSQLQPEQIIETYFKALDSGDYHTARRCMSRKTLMQRLTTNMPDNLLYSESYFLPLAGEWFGDKSNPLGNLSSAELVSIEQIDTSKYKVIVNLQYRDNDLTSNGSGEQFWECYMVYESPQTGWKIIEFGH